MEATVGAVVDVELELAHTFVELPRERGIRVVPLGDHGLAERSEVVALLGAEGLQLVDAQLVVARVRRDLGRAHGTRADECGGDRAGDHGQGQHRHPRTGRSPHRDEGTGRHPGRRGPSSRKHRMCSERAATPDGDGESLDYAPSR